MRRAFIFVTIFVFVICSANVYAGTARTAAPFLSSDGGTRAAGMPDAFTAVSGDIISAFWNPGGLASISERQATIAYSNVSAMFGDASEGMYYALMAFAMPVSDIGVFGTTLQLYGQGTTVKTRAVLVCSSIATAKGIHHYVFFNRDRERISEHGFLETSAFEGAQLKYTWKELEPEKDNYNFSIIQSDLDFLTSKEKKLFIQLQDVSFDISIINVPQYLCEDNNYNGGVAKQYRYEGNDEKNAVPEGWVARRWDPAVQKRFQKLLFALGKEFDGKIEGINLPETSVEFGESGWLFPKGFTFDVYKNAIISNMKALKRAFPKSVTMQYANFMPGEWLPWKNESYLSSVYQSAQELKVGVGGPDLLPYRKGQMNHSYQFIRQSDGIVPTGIAVQWGNYEYTNPKTGKQVTVQELLEFGRDYLKVDYIFWCPQEPYYSERLIPFLQ